MKKNGLKLIYKLSKKNMNNVELIYTGIGKRKTAVAKIFLKEGSGIIKVNNKSFDESFLNLKEERNFIKNPLVLLKLTNEYDVDIYVKGGGIMAQLDAIRLGIAKAIASIKTEYRTNLNQYFLLRRDSRIKERRKYGLKKARKASQFSKR
jgi:small subunit ribosomal protein S9